MKVLLMAFECSPYRSSEWAVGWGRLLQASRVAETHVVTSEENFADLERAKQEGLLPENVSFYTPEPDAKLRARDVHTGLFAYNYAAYHHWHKLALPLVKELHQQVGFDLVHQVSVNTFREPGYAWKLGIPFLWGPVGGTQNFPWRFLPMLPAAEAAKEAVRAVANELSLRYKRRVRKAAKRAAKVIASNSRNQHDYERTFGRSVSRLLETGLQHVDVPDRTRFVERLRMQQSHEEPKPLQLLWAGQLQTRKALPVLLRALALVGNRMDWELTVLGDGPMRKLWTEEATKLGLSDRVKFHGRLPFNAAVQAMNHADVFCFTSLRDTSGNVVLEALAAGVPVVCFDHQGVGDMVAENCGIKLPVVSPARAAQDWAAALLDLGNDPQKLLALSQATTARAEMYLWERNGDVVNTMYQQLAATKS